MLRRTGIKRKAKSKPASERRHHERVASLPCAACGSSPVEVHHVIFDGRARITRNHRLVVPLCPFTCHRTGPQAVHVIGERAFWELHGINLYERAQRLWEESENG